MAGIGFVLAKILKEGSFTAVLKVAAAGIMIVAGPWVLSIVGLSAITGLGGSALTEGQSLFTLLIVQAYAFSLIVCGGFHYLFSRQTSDVVFLKRERQASTIMLWYGLFLGIVAAGLALFALSGIDMSLVRRPDLLAAGAIILFVSVNLTWLLIIFISLLHWYGRIFFSYAASIVVSFVLVTILGKDNGVGGAMLGYGLGQLSLTVFLSILSFGKYPPKWIKLREWFASPPRIYLLFLIGLFYYAGIWADKVIFWSFFGAPIPGSSFLLYDRYDISVFYANLTMIPGLIYFVVLGETSFYTAIQNFIVALEKDTYQVMQQRKWELMDSVKVHLATQTAFQVACSIFIALIAQAVFSNLILPANFMLFYLVLAGTVAQLCFLMVLMYLFYLEAFGKATILCLLFLVLNAGFALVTGFWLGEAWVGVGFLAACVISAIAGLPALFAALRRFDRTVYLRAGGD